MGICQSTTIKKDDIYDSIDTSQLQMIEIIPNRYKQYKRIRQLNINELYKLEINKNKI